MKEEFISYLWGNCLLFPEGLTTTLGAPVTIVHPGYQNYDSGPDFTAARIRIGSTLWVGNVEIHLKASDWNRHRHHLDEAYRNIILHVVCHCDEDIRTCDGHMPPTLEIYDRFDQEMYYNYQQLKSAASWIPCQQSIAGTDDLLLNNWLSRLSVERLERKTEEIKQYLLLSKGNWEETLYFLLARNFGFRVNAIPFGMLARRTPYLLIRKGMGRPDMMEAILFGQAGMLHGKFEEPYPAMLQKEYEYHRKTRNLKPLEPSIWKFSKIRPVNFPTIRIAQFSALLCNNCHLFSQATEADDLESLERIFSSMASTYWNTHYHFGYTSKFHPKRTGREAVWNILINTVVPLLFLFGRETMKPQVSELALDILHSIGAENNHIVRKWKQLGVPVKDAAGSQALIELKKSYCTPKKCLKCPIGHYLILGD